MDRRRRADLESVVAFFALVGWALVVRLVPVEILAAPLEEILRAVFSFNVLLAIFNLIPLPPLDGGHFLPYVLPSRKWALIHSLEQVGPLLLLLLVMSGGTRYLVDPIYTRVVTAYFAVLRTIL